MKIHIDVPTKYLYDYDVYQDFIYIYPQACKYDLYKEYIKSTKKMKVLGSEMDNDKNKIRELLDLALDLNVDYIVVPSIFENTNETLKLCDMFYNEFMRSNLKINTIIVPQGINFSEFCICLYKILNYPFKGILLPIKTSSLENPESLRLKKVEAIINVSNVDIFLLECESTAYIGEYKKYLQVKYITTSLPILYGYMNQVLNNMNKIKIEKFDNFYDLIFNHEQYETARKNADFFKGLTR